MKILRLFLKNSKHILSAIDKTEINLDFSASDKIINVLIGKIGSGKTVILGHLQPFASFGTLDVRNQDGVIIDGEDGLKIIEYKKENDYYTITHKYVWNKTSHIIKSYIEKNGVELNENGNQGSFKDIIAYEFGIEQNFLRLLRLGSNVSNVISMKSTERKSFVASLLKAADAYTFLYKKLTDEMRNLNSQTSILSGKLHHIGAENLDAYQDEYENIKEMIGELTSGHDEVKSEIFKLDAFISSVLEGESYETYEQEYNRNFKLVSELKDNIDNIKEEIRTYKEYPSILEVSKILGGLDTDLYTNNKNITDEGIRYSDLARQLSIFIDNRKVKNNKEHLAELEDTYTELLNKLDLYKKEIKGFDLNYSSSYILSLLGDIDTINVLIDDIAQYDKAIIKKIYFSDSSVIGWSKKQIEIAQFQKMNVQKEINSIKFSDKYETTCTLYLPPLCPTKECPYYKSHPYNIQKGIKKDNIGVEAEVEILLNKAKEIDNRIYRYYDYPMLYSKITNLKQIWARITPIVEILGAINNKKLIDVLTNFQYRRWYDYDNIAKVMELSEKREKYYELTESVNKIKNEISNIKLLEDSTIDEKINNMSLEMEKSASKISEYESNIKNIEGRIKDYNLIYIKLSQLSILENDFKEKQIQYNALITMIQKMEINLDKIKDNINIIKKYKLEASEIYSKLQNYINKSEKVKLNINEIIYTKNEFSNVIDDKETTKYILDAVSSKEGIPLIFVKLFLNDARDILNDLVSDVFGDVIEIQEFEITQDDFKIPYTINGTYVEDIEKASQGQQSIISIALSFALIRKSIFDYNIMLLDEVDAPLYKHDREKFISILFKQLTAINAEQVFLISHNNTFDGYPVNIIMTTEEIVDESELNSVIRLY